MKTSTELKRGVMDMNISFKDRQVRFVAGAAVIAATLVAAPDSLGNWSYLLLASIPLITFAIIGWDPFYALAGKSTYVEGEEDIHQRSWTCPNIGRIDRTARFIIGAMLIYTLLTANVVNAEVVLTLLAIPLIVTAIAAWDPLYAIFGINSFASRTDVKAAEPEISERTLATCYTLPQRRPSSAYTRRAA